MSKNRRIDRVSSLLKKEITMIILNDLQGEINNYSFISITRIEISSDFQYSKIYVKSGDNQEINKIVDNLNMVKNNIRHILSNRIDMRRVPEILFKEDKVMEKGLNVLKILDKIRENKNSKNIISIDTND